MDKSSLKQKMLNIAKRFMNNDIESNNNKISLNFINLQFPKSNEYLEKNFQEKYFQSNLSHIRNCHFYTIIFYLLAGLIDYSLFPEDLLPIFAIRFLVVVPIFIFGYFFSYSAWYKQNWREISFFYILLTGSSFIFFTVIGQAPESYNYWVGILFCMVFGYTFIREPFIYASVAGCILLILYLIIATFVTKIPTDTMILSFFYLTLINFLGMLISRYFEVSARKDFFLEHILFIEQKKVINLNNELERKVKARTSDLNISNQLLNTKIEELNISETTHRHFVDNAPMGMYSINLKGEFTYINKRLEEITGYEAKDWLGKSFHPIVYPEDLKIVIKIFNSRIKGNINLEPYQVRIINSQNEILWVKITSESIIEEKEQIKNISGIQSFIEDVTNANRSQGINQTLFAISNAVNSTKNLSDLYKKIHDLLGKVIDVTNFFIAIVNEKKHTLYFPYHVDTIDDDFSPITNFDPKDSLTGFVVSNRKPLLIKKKKLQELADRDGVWGPVPLIWMGVPLVVKDEIIGVIVVQSYTNANLYTKQDLEVLSSISDQVAVAIDRKSTEDELSKSEEKFRTAFKTSPYVITLTRVEDGVYVDINDAFTKLLGYSPEEVIGKSSVELKIWNDLKDRDRLVSGLINDGLVENLQADFIGKNGQIINGLMSARTLDIENKKHLLS
ncbi:PAS domain S-box protein, partial [bacterium]|nr:PAS domain S-box protein [bacterium]